ncbi:MAG: guanylate kinase [Candidatus Auribacterota bacterium]|jgi:guanylate kinase|nr:guanylate kinase [Candidatus Auribacterota bacterium]
MKTEAKGLLLVVSAPSGAGKTTICKKFLKKNDTVKYAISTTTRLPRQGEQDGVDYHFTSKETFLKMVENGAFLEYAKVYNEFYGTSRKTVTELIEHGYDVLADVDTQGASSIRKLIPESIHIFILPPSLKVLEQRLRDRGKDRDEVIKLRLSEAKTEIRQSYLYDYVIINDKVDSAVDVLQSILIANRSDTNRNQGVIRTLLGENNE